VTLPAVTILDVMDNEKLFARWFRNPTTWHAWRVFLSVLFGLPIGIGDLDLFRRCTGLVEPPGRGHRGLADLRPAER
jgi:hypothetical protein